MKRKVIASSAMLIVLLSGTSYAQTVTTKTIVQPQLVPNVVTVNFSAFDRNKNGAYSMIEVGERLFEAFDLDHNEMIDNTEWDRKTVMTITPMERQTFTFVDYDDDTMPENSTYTYETFYRASGLIKFDHNQNGLSAAEFIDAGFQWLDDDEDNLINLEEWKEAYMQTRPEHDQPERYNN
ncbi:MAG: hypothetical protein L6Q57_09730 [Alphaproteobacteria bacterium]|nr:hypothetical protein [Alphaproteobacteria bacterium]